MGRKLWQAACAALCVGLVGACVGDTVVVEVNGEVDSLTILNIVDSLAIREGTTPAITEELVLQVGDTAVLNATAFNPLGLAISIDAIDWLSTVPQVASVNMGVVAALAPGNTNIVASVDGISALIPTTVEDPASQGSIQITPTSLSLTALGETAQLTVTARDSDGATVTTPPVDWSSSNSNVASVSGSGLVTLNDFGVAMIRADAGCCAFDEIQVVGSGGTALEGSLEISPTSLSFTEVGQTAQLTATARDSLGATIPPPAMTWTSTNPSVASVSSSGLVTLNAFGVATVSVDAECCASDDILVVGSGSATDGVINYAVDWGTGTGAGMNAITDGGIMVPVNPEAVSVWPRVDSLPDAPSTWPANMVRMRFLGGGNGNFLILGNDWGDAVMPVPPVGSSAGYRFLFHNTSDCSADNLTSGQGHGFQTNTGFLAMFIHIVCGGRGDVGNDGVIGFGIGSAGSPLNSASYRTWDRPGAGVPENGYFRIEWLLGRPTVNTMQILGMRIYDDTTSPPTLLADTDDMYRYISPNDRLSDTQLIVNVGSVSAGTTWGAFMFGDSGPPGGRSGCCWWYGGFARAFDGWAGPYLPGEGPN